MSMQRYTPVAHFNGTLTKKISMTEKLPWLYIIASLKQKVLYIGETFDEAGLASRLSTHFGRPLNSSFKKCAADNAGIRNVMPPYLVIGARLPFNDDDAPFNGESKIVRKACESLLHEIITSKFILPNKWIIISSASTSIELTDEMRSSCIEIFDNFSASFTFFENLSSEVLPFNLVILDRLIEKEEAPLPNIGEIIEDIELQLFDWILQVLKNEHESDWWTQGVKRPIRVSCATRQEEEGANDSVPKEAYLTLIDIKAIIEGNWGLFSAVMEEVSGFQGKVKATNWIGDINEKRKLWAHPLKQRFISIDPSSVNMVSRYQSKLRHAILNDL